MAFLRNATCYFFSLEAHERQIKQWEADVKIPLTSDLKHSHMAAEGTSVAVPSLIDLSEKVRIQSPVIITSSLMKSPTTGQ